MSTSDPLGSLKRKRDDSIAEVIPSKRPAPVISGATTTPSDAVSSSEPTTADTFSTAAPTQTRAPLLDRYRADPHNFPIHTLTGAEADEWRKLTVGHMFTLAESEAAPPVKADEKEGRDGRGGKGQGKQQKKGKKGRTDQPQPSITDDKDKSSEAPPPTTTNGRRDRGPARFNPAKSFHQLPRFALPSLPSSSLSSSSATQPSPSSSAPHLTPSCAYLVLGPRMRGRFNAQRADELGLKGPLRGRVSKGGDCHVLCGGG